MTHDISPDHSAAQAAWRLMLGEDRVLEAPQAQARWGADTSGLTRPIAGGVRPQSADQVAEVVSVAHQFGVKLHPISTGHNWGYGTALPPQDHQVILDLSDLRRIVDFDAELGVVTVEPGVTQGMLHEFLTAGGHPYMVPTTGAGPDCSLVGNALQRGYGITPICDHWSAVTDLEAVRWDGTVEKSTLVEAGSLDLARLHRWGVGPHRAGLYSQSRAGVVTRMSLALAVRPKAIRLVVFNIPTGADLVRIVPAVRELLAALPGVIGGINLMNRLRVLAMTAPYPAERIGPQGVLPDSVIEELGGQYQVSAWTGIATVYGTQAVAQAACREIERRLRLLGLKPIFLDSQRAQWAHRLAKWAPGAWGRRMADRTAALKGALELTAGIPNRTALPLAYWRTPAGFHSGISRDPAADGCGLLWYAPLVPMRSTAVEAVVRMIETTLRTSGFEPLITLTSISERLFDATTPILFDGRDRTASASAQAVFRELVNHGKALGAYPYRNSSINGSPVTARVTGT